MVVSIIDATNSLYLLWKPNIDEEMCSDVCNYNKGC